MQKPNMSCMSLLGPTRVNWFPKLISVKAGSGATRHPFPLESVCID